MNDLEKAVQPVLLPFLEKQGDIVATPVQTEALAVWALKTFMTYAMTRGSQTNPFNPEDYANLRRDRTIPPWVRVWLGTADSRWAHVGLQLKSWSMGAAGERVEDTADNCALGVLSAGGAVFTLAKVLPQLPQLAAELGPPKPRLRGGLRELTTSPRKAVRLAPNLLDEGYMESLDMWMWMPQQEILPTPVGLTPEQVGEINAMAAQGVPRSALLRLLPDNSIPQELEAAQEHVDASLEQAKAARDAADPVGAALFLTRSGREHFYAGDFWGAARLLEAAASEPAGGLEDDGEAAYRVGQCYWNLRDPRCVDWYRRSIELGVPTKGAQFGLVDGLTWGGEYEQALASLEKIRPSTAHERATVLAAGESLQFLVHKLGLRQQERREPTEEQLANPALETLKATDATSAALWANMTSIDMHHSYQLARAWFGNSADAWLIAALGISQHERRRVVVEFLELGLTRSAALHINGPAWIGTMSDAGLPMDLVRAALDEARRRASSDRHPSWLERTLATVRSAARTGR